MEGKAHPGPLVQKHWCNGSPADGLDFPVYTTETGGGRENTTFKVVQENIGEAASPSNGLKMMPSLLSQKVDDLTSHWSKQNGSTQRHQPKDCVEKVKQKQKQKWQQRKSAETRH